jgi:hypothetical protein
MRRAKKGETSWLFRGYVHIILFITGVTTFGFLDGLTAVLMMERYGIGAEFNPLMRLLFFTHGAVGFIAFKVIAAALILSVPGLLHVYSRGRMHWTAVLFSAVFAVSGALAAANNYHLLTRGQVVIEPVIVVGAVLLLTIAALYIGELLDYASVRAKLFKISEERWVQMKHEMGYPV